MIKLLYPSILILIIFSLLLCSSTLAKSSENKSENMPEFGTNPSDFPVIQISNLKQDKELSKEDYYTSINSKPGDKLLVKIYIHNNQANTVAKNTKVIATLIKEKNNNTYNVLAILSADNTRTIGGQVSINTNQPIKLNYVENTTKIWWFTDEKMAQSQYKVLENNILTNGINIGDIKGTWQDVHTVTFVLDVIADNIPVFNNHPNDYATMRVANANNPESFGTSVQAKPGDEIIYSIFVHNNVIDSTAINTSVMAALDNSVATTHGGMATVWATNATPVAGNTVVYTTVPTTIKYIPNSTYRFVTNEHIDWEAMPDGVIGNGLVLGDLVGCFEYIQQIIFRAKVGVPDK